MLRYRPVSRYRIPDDSGQVTSPVTEPRVWTLNGEWNEAASEQRNMLSLSNWRGSSSTCLNRDECLGLGLLTTPPVLSSLSQCWMCPIFGYKLWAKGPLDFLLFVLVVVLPIKCHGGKHKESVIMNVQVGPTWLKRGTCVRSDIC